MNFTLSLWQSRLLWEKNLLHVIWSNANVCSVCTQHLCHHARIVLRCHLVESWHFGTMFLIVTQMEASKTYSAMLTLVTAGAWAIMDWSLLKHKAGKCQTVSHLVSQCFLSFICIHLCSPVCQLGLHQLFLYCSVLCFPFYLILHVASFLLPGSNSTVLFRCLWALAEICIEGRYDRGFFKIETV